MTKLYITGVGPGDPELVTPAVMRVLEGCDVLIGGRRNLEQFRYLKKEEVVIDGRLEAIESYVRENAGKKSVAVLASGDPGVFSISQYLKSRLPDAEFEVHPGISSLQYLCARVRKSWEDVFITSLHGRVSANIASLVEGHGRVAVFTGGGSSPDGVCRELIHDGLMDAEVTVGENLSYPRERIVTGKPEDIARMSFDSLSIMLVEKPFTNEEPRPWGFATQGIPDGMFIRGDVPMTKEEVRTVSLSKLRLREDSVVYDIGAGTGSVSVECGLKLKSGRVYAIEKERDALELIRRNVMKFRPGNVTVIEGEAPGALDGLPEPDRVFIGGTGGKLEAILDRIAQTDRGTHRDRDVRVVVNAVAVETVYEALDGFKRRGFGDIDAACISVSKGRLAGDRHLMMAQNPVYVVSAEISV